MFDPVFGENRLINQRRGFTLIELLVVMVIIVIMYVTLTGVWSSSWQKQQLAACLKQMQVIHVALKMYAQEHDGRFPATASAITSAEPLALLVPKYTTQTSQFICPGTKQPPPPPSLPLEKCHISYAYYMGHTTASSATMPLLSDAQADAQPKIATQVLFSPDGKSAGNNHYSFGGNILFCDGHAESHPAHAAKDLPIPPHVILLNPRP